MVKRYPLLEIVSRHGRRLSLAVAVIVAVLSPAAWAMGASASAALVVLLAAPLVFFGLRLVAELVEVVADTLMPR